jgi:glycerate kinase
VDATFALEDGLAVIEMAAASGLVLLAPQERDALRASTYGTGELIRAALDLGVRRLVIGIGGSATNDGGAGLLVALGARLLDERGMPLPPGGAALAALRTIDLSGLDPRLAGAEISVASDVDVPLCGPSGASAIFGPQKGASPEDVRRLDAALAHFADVTARTVSGADHRDDPGAGAAGGLGFALIAFLGARFRPGVELIAELLGLDAALRGADLCLTGEGRIDEQTLRGKTVDGVARLARRYRVPVIAFGGSIDPAAEDELYRRGVVCCIPIVAGPITLETASGEAARLTEDAAARIARFWLAGQRPDDGEAETAAGTSAGLT